MENKIYEYTSFPRQFVRYKWFKPLLVALIGAVLTIILQSALSFVAVLWAGVGTDKIAEVQSRSGEFFYAGPGALAAISTVAVMLPALAIAALIVRDRPFSSYSSSRGGWNWKSFCVSFLIAAVVFGGIIVGEFMISPDPNADGVNRFTVAGFLLVVFLVPIQAIAEEYVYRGLLMQTIGSWTKLPVLAILLSSIVFAVSHTYSWIGLVAVLVHGLMFAFLTWYTKGLEASSAAHVANNLTVFLCGGFGLSSSGESGVDSMILVIVMSVIYTAIIVLIHKKTGVFNSKGDGTLKFNEKYSHKQEIQKQQTAE